MAPPAEIQWSPGIGDPSVVGWVTVVAYLWAAWLCLRAFMAEKAGPRRPYIASMAALLRVLRKHWPHPPRTARRAALWLLLAFALGSLGINKQLDLQSLLTDVARVMAHRQGWYEDRRTVQVAFIALIAFFGLCGLGALTWFLRHALEGFALALGGMLWLVCFVVIRASSFHHVDVLIKTELAGVKLNWLFELTGIGLVALAALRRVREAKPATER